MKKQNQFYPVLLLVVAAALYVAWYGSTLPESGVAETVPTGTVMPTLPGLPAEDAEETTAESSAGPYGTSSASEEPPLTETQEPAAGTNVSFAFPLGAPEMVATPPEWAGDGLPHDKLFITVER